MNDFLGHIPTYGEIVDVYNIDVLKTGGDLQLTETGDIAITADGDLQFGNWENAEPLIEGYSVGAVVVAGANNFRHHDEWAKTAQPTEQQLRSIKVIAAVLKEPISNGISFRDNVCAKLLEAMSCGNFETLSERFLALQKQWLHECSGHALRPTPGGSFFGRGKFAGGARAPPSGTEV